METASGAWVEAVRLHSIHRKSRSGKTVVRAGTVAPRGRGSQGPVRGDHATRPQLDRTSPGITPLDEGAMRAVRGCGWRSEVFGADNAAATMDPPRQVTDVADRLPTQRFLASDGHCQVGGAGSLGRSVRC